MKLFFIVLLATYYQRTFAQEPINTDSNQGITSSYIEVDPFAIENTPFLLSLINYGSQYVIGQAADSKVLRVSSGNYTKIYHLYQHANNSINISAVVQLTASDGTKLKASFLAHYDPINNLKEIFSFSFEVQNYNVLSPSGLNISWSQDNNNTYQVTSFSGVKQWIDYQRGTLKNTTISGTSQDYLENYVGYKRVVKAEIYSNKTIQNSLNIGLQALGESASSEGLLYGSLSQLGVTEINSIYSRISAKRGSYYRYDVQIENNDQIGRAVYIIVCPNIFANNTAAEEENAKYYYDEQGEFYYYYGPYVTPVVNNNANLNTNCISGDLLYHWFQSIQG